MCLILPRTRQSGSGGRVENNWCHLSAQSTRCWALPKCLWWTNKKYSVFISVPQSAQWINSERIYSQTRVSFFPGLVSVARVNELRTTNVTRVLKAPGAELCQNSCDERTKKIFFTYTYTYTIFCRKWFCHFPWTCNFLSRFIQILIKWYFPLDFFSDLLCKSEFNS